jgi:hypothetical protein
VTHSLALDVIRLKNSKGSPLEPETAKAAANVMCFFDTILNVISLSGRRVYLPRGYYFDVSMQGYFQLCMPVWVESEEESAGIFAKDVADGLLEEIIVALDPEWAERVRNELGL